MPAAIHLRIRIRVEKRRVVADPGRKDMSNQHRYKITAHPRLLLAWLCLLCVSAHAAEVRGVVSVQQTGMFDGRSEALKTMPISVALYPAEGQVLSRHAAMDHVLSVEGSRILPVYLAVSRGDRLRFENQDDVYHELFTQSKTLPIALRLDRTGLGRSTEIVLNEVDDLHWFCHIHAKSYARVDVVDTPVVRMVKPGEQFEFRNLATGKWRLRVAAPGAETRMIEAEALTAPPPIDIRLSVKGFNPAARGSTQTQAVTVEQLFPSQPGL